MRWIFKAQGARARSEPWMEEQNVSKDEGHFWFPELNNLAPAAQGALVDSGSPFHRFVPEDHHSSWDMVGTPQPMGCVPQAAWPQQLEFQLAATSKAGPH